MSQHARGTFEVTITPEGLPDSGDGSALGRMSLAKVFHGDLEGTSNGTMLTASATSTPGSAAYVAVERFTGTLAGRQGSFALVHRGVMSAATRDLSVAVVPDSGSGDLEGLAGTLDIRIDALGGHGYDLAFTLP